MHSGFSLSFHDAAGTCALALLAAASLLGATAPSQPPLRELTTDRPDTTESPFTVNPGHVQLEMSVASFTRDRLDGVRTTEWELAPFNLRFGLQPDFELGVFITPHVHRTEQLRGGPKTTVRGMGDTTLRAKYNFWGNDGGSTAGGIIADLKIPTAAEGLGNDKVEGALTFPIAFEVGGGWEGAAMTAVEFVYTDAGNRRPVWLNTLTFAHDIAGDVAGFLELTSSTGEGSHVATFNCGLTRRLNPNLQLDCGVNIGITRVAPDLGLFVGLSRRF